MQFRNWILVIIAVVGIALWVTRGRPVKSEKVDDKLVQGDSSGTRIEPPKARKPLQKLYASPRPKLTEMEKTDTRLSPGCARTWDSLRTENFATDKQLKGLTGQTLKECEMPPKELKAVHEKFVKACSQFADPKSQSEETRQQCMDAGFQYRGRIAQYLNRDRNLADIDDVGVLSDLLLANLYSDESGQSNLDTLRGTMAVAERMLEVDPELPLYTMVAGTRTADYFQSLNDGESPAGPKQQATLKALDASLVEKPDDKPSLSAKLWVAGAGDSQKHLEAANLAAEQNPNSPVPLFHQAVANAALGNDELASEQMKEGRERFPNEPNFLKDPKTATSRQVFKTDTRSFMADTSASRE